MAGNISQFKWNPTPEERAAVRQAAQEERERVIQQAIKNGASIQYMTSRITQDEQETHIGWTLDGKCMIDTTIPKDITKCIKRNWKIKSITYYANTDIIAGLVCEGKSNNITISNIK
jgi:hypothetical protein